MFPFPWKNVEEQYFLHFDPTASPSVFITCQPFSLQMHKADLANSESRVRTREIAEDVGAVQIFQAEHADLVFGTVTGPEPRDRDRFDLDFPRSSKRSKLCDFFANFWAKSILVIKIWGF